jgi:Uma2 family endonuclease
MSTALRWTTDDLETMPQLEGQRYEIIDGKLYVTTQPHFNHQFVCTRLTRFLDEWDDQANAGVVVQAPGVVFTKDEAVAPDAVWISNERFATGLDASGHLRVAPELVVEVVSPGSTNERRDREVKLKLYSRRGVHEYWIVDWRQRQVEVFRREQAALRLIETLFGEDELRSPLLPNFACRVAQLFVDAK